MINDKAPSRDAKLISIGNSKGIRIPKVLLQKYGIEDNIILEECENGILMHAKEENKLSWNETFKQIAQSDESWEDFEITSADGLEADDESQKI